MSQNANNLIDRLKQELSLNKDKDLCLLLDIKQNTLSTWRKRDSIDFNKVITLCELRGLDLNYIFFEDVKESQEVVSRVLDHSQIVKKELQPFIITKLVSNNRNIALFVNSSNTDTSVDNLLYVSQKISIKKLSHKSKYIFELLNGSLFVDTLLVDIEKPPEVVFLEEHSEKLAVDKIAKVWQVLEESKLPVV